MYVFFLYVTYAKYRPPIWKIAFCAITKPHEKSGKLHGKARDASRNPAQNGHGKN